MSIPEDDLENLLSKGRHIKLVSIEIYVRGKYSNHINSEPGYLRTLSFDENDKYIQKESTLY